ncbi:Multiple RNA-binding domain-containing protein 1 [Dimargaris cristalligena]|nr:Multiple RNA-binding domain-containing protein 1 [Dimargaris cristalligena]
MRTKEGNSRMFGFVGFRTDKAAQLAVRHFNGTYIDTALISVELAKSFKDETLARPWSAHSEGSSAFERRQQQTTAKSKGTKGGHQFNVIDIKKQNQTVTEAIPKKKKQVKLLYESTLNNPKFQEFAQVMAPRHQSKTWANDDLPGTQNDTTIAPSLKTTKVKAQVHAVPNKKPGGAGMVVTKTHVTFADSDDEYEDMPSKPTEKATPASAAPKKEQSDGESDEKNEGEDAPTEAPEPAMSDLEWVRSRMRNTDLTDVDLDAEAVAETTGDNPHSDSASSSDEEPIVDAAIDEVVSDTKMAKPTMPAPETPPTFDNPGKVDTKAADYDPQEIIMETGRLFLRNLPYTCTEEDLRKRFEKFGPLAEVHMPIERDTKQPKGYAYILFVLPEHAWEAFRAMDTKFFQGRLLHVLPAKEKFTPKEFNALNPTLGEPLTSVKKQRELKKKATSKLDFNWNSLYMSQDAVLDSIAERLEVTKDEILDPSASNMAVRMALAETHILNETKAYLEEHGLVLDSLAKKERSETVILVKNIPHSTTEEELRDIFGKHGNLGRILLPPARTIAVVEFLEASEARSAFRFLAYRRFKDSVIYLEKAPVGLFKDKYNAKVHKKQKAASATAASATDSSRLDSSATTKSKGVDATATEASDIQGSADSNASDPVQGVTLFIKNLSFLTQDADFQELCGSIPGLRSAVIRMKPDPKHPGSQLSMGFGFAEYQTPQLAQRAIQALQGRVLDGHALEVKLTNHVTGDQSSSRRAKRAAAESATQGQGSTKLVIRNVAFEATKKELRELLSNYGQLKSIRLPSKMDGSHRGFAFAEFLTLQEAKRVKDTLNHTHLYGRHLVIEFAEKDTTDLEELRARSTKDYRAAVEDKRHSKRIKLNDEE